MPMRIWSRNLLLIGGLLCVSAAPYSIHAEMIQTAGRDFAGTALGWDAQSGAKVSNYQVSYRMPGSLAVLLKIREGLTDVAFVLQTTYGHPNLG
ncbi:MAG: hypothetical protein CMI18_10340 [Opitutaceae bacterium]|nr:hypothetical protein [Opitutaceae bacterium]